MKKIIIWIAVALVSVGAMIGVYALYNNLSESFEHEVPQLPNLPSQNETVENNKPEPDGTVTDAVEPDAPEGDEDIPTDVPSTPDLPEDTGAIVDTGDAEPETEPEPVTFNAPDFTFYDANGNPVKLSSFAGKPIVLNIWASWCGPCQAEMPDFDEMYKKYPDVQFLMVNATSTESMSTAKHYIDTNGFEFPVFYDLDGAALATYGVTGFPTTILITKGGELVFNQAGMLTATQLEGVIKQLIQLN